MPKAKKTTKKKVAKKTARKAKSGKTTKKKTATRKAATKRPTKKKTSAKKTAQIKPSSVEGSVLLAEKELRKKKIIKTVKIKSKKTSAKKITVKNIKNTLKKNLAARKITPKKQLIMARKAYAKAPYNLPIAKKSKKIKIIKSIYSVPNSPHIIDLKNNINNPAPKKEKENKNTLPNKLTNFRFTKPKKKFEFKKIISKIKLPDFHIKNRLKTPTKTASISFGDKKEAWSELLVVNLFQLLGAFFWTVGIFSIKAIKNFYNLLERAAIVCARAIPRKTYSEGALLYFSIIKNVFLFAANILFSPFYLMKYLTWRMREPILNVEFAKPSLPSGWPKKLLAFAVMGIVMVSPLQGLLYYENAQTEKINLINKSREAVKSLEEAKNLSLIDPQTASQKLREAINNFGSAERQLEEMNAILVEAAKLIPVTGEEVRAGENLIQAGKKIAEAGEFLTKEFTTSENESLYLTKKINAAQIGLSKALPLLKQANNQIQQVDSSSLPGEYKGQFSNLKKELPALIVHGENFIQFSDAILNILGHEQTKRYLVFFQNNAEMRPTGGFLGSFALLDLDRGEIKNLEVPAGGTYDMNGGLRERILAPKPLHLINTRWELQDANWFADFPASAQKIMWFYEKSGGPTVDGVITFTPDVIEKLLPIIGPVDMTEDYGEIINENNFWSVVQREAEKKFYITRESKKIIGEMAPIVLERILNSPKDDFIKILAVLNNLLEEKYILMNFNDPEVQKIASDFGWTGEIKNTSLDYLAVIDTNISGGKTDRLVDTDIIHEAKIADNGKIIDTITITKKHNGQKGAEFGGVNNLDYLRIFVPTGSKLISAEGFSEPPKQLFEIPEKDLEEDAKLINTEKIIGIDAESDTYILSSFDKTVFANWLMTKPGETTRVKITYELPFAVNLEDERNFWEKLMGKNQGGVYSLFVQKQPGTNHNFSSFVKLPKNSAAIWKYPVALSAKNLEENSWSLNTILDKDKFIALILNK